MHLDYLENSKLLLSYFLAFIFTASAAEWNTKDYMKREHSLIKPYQGEVTQRDVDFYYDCFLK